LIAIAAGEQQPVVLAQMSEEEKKVMSRKEKLEEMRNRGRGKMARKKTSAVPAGFNYNIPQVN